ncbi:MAG: hypothetical protein ABR555_08925 [Pyrinomonadaceae bacterium]
MNLKFLRFYACIALLLLTINAPAQTGVINPSTPATEATTTPPQNVAASLSTLPEADALIYISPRKILNDVVPKFLSPTDLAQMQSSFRDIKQAVGVDPATIEYVVIAVRFHKPGADLSFVAPDIMMVTSGDFSADSLLTFARLSMQQNARDEKYGSKTLTVLKIDKLAEEAAKNPLLKSFGEIGAVSLNANTLAIGNTSYLRVAIDALDGKGRITASSLDSLLRDQNAIMSAAGSPVKSLAKSFGLMGTESVPRASPCETKFGDFYSAVTMDGTHFSFRGAINADNPDTAKIINGLLSGLLQQAISSVPDKNAQSVLQGIRMLPRGDEVVWEADIAQQSLIDFVREQMKPKPVVAPPPPPHPQKRPVTRRRVRHK